MNSHKKLSKWEVEIEAFSKDESLLSRIMKSTVYASSQAAAIAAGRRKIFKKHNLNKDYRTRTISCNEC